jgi:hypothetical protein
MKQYKWKLPKNKLEEIEKLTLIEDRGDRVLVYSNFTETDNIPSTHCYKKNDLMELS